MYDFIDVNEAAVGSSLPAEALRLNGDYLEILIPGYRTLYVSGRELLAQELETTEITRRSGTLYRFRRYPERVITVGFQLIAEDSEAFRSAFNKLAGALNVEEAELVFADEPDKFFIGTPTGVGDVEPGRNVVASEFEITCTDPFKYSLEEYEVEPTADDGSTFVVDYRGTAPSFPTFEAAFFSEEETSEDGESDVPLTGDGDCGYVAFLDEDSHILQFGDPDEADKTLVKSQTLVNQTFKKSTSWGTAVQSKWGSVAGITTSDAVVKAGSPKMAKSVSTDPNYYLTANSYGSGEKWHGPSITRVVPADVSGEVGAANCKLTYYIKFHIAKGKTGEKQYGCFQALLVSNENGTRKIVAGAAIWKSRAGTKGHIRFYVNGKVKQDVNISLAYANKYFGTGKSVKTCTITKSGGKITFNIGGVKRTFTDNGIKNTKVKQITFGIYKYGTLSAVMCNGLYWAKFVKNKVDTWKEVPNKFSTDDVLTADCRSAEVLLNDDPTPELGAPGNDWETFCLKPGVNQIGTAYSDWVLEAYKPTFKMRYREVFL